MNAPLDVSFFARAAKPITSYRKYWASRFGTAPFLPMSRAEMDKLGWDSCDIILVTGDAYVGRHGRSRRLHGLEPQNNLAFARAIVIHGADYVDMRMALLALTDDDTPVWWQQVSTTRQSLMPIL